MLLITLVMSSIRWELAAMVFMVSITSRVTASPVRALFTASCTSLPA